MGRIGIRQYTLLAILALTAVIVATFVVQKTILTQAAPGINKTINFQGKMTNASGLNVPNGTYQFVFRLYNVASGGSAAWTETVSLPVTDGIFHHNLGSVSALPGSVDFDTDNIFLGITFNSDPAGEMSPRVQLTASPYAFNSDKLDGLDASAFLQLDPSTAQLGSIAITGNMSAGGTATASRFISNVATGTAPLTVTSTTMVANLNADLLDGQHGAYYRNASNINAGTLSDARLSANVSLLGQTIGFSELEANSVDSSKVVNNSLTADDLAANSVDSSEIVDGSVDESHLNITNAPTAGNVLQFGGSNNFTWVNPATLPTSGVSSLNTLTGSLTLQGNAQVGVSSAGSVISLSIQNDSIGDAQLAFNTGQHLTVTSSPTFAGLTVNGDITMAGSNTLDLNSGRIAFAKSGLNKFSNLAAFDTSGNVTGAIVIKTNIPRNSRMNWVRFKGYNYTSNPILDLTIAGYWYNSGYSWNNRGFVNNGGRTPSNVQFGVDSSDNVVIIIGSTTDTWSYPHFLVDEWVIGTGNASNADASNWQIAVEDDLSAYSNTVAVANDSFTPYDPQYVNVTGDTMTGALTVNSTVTATLFSGSGASLTNLNASNLASGTVPNARISGSYTGFTNVTGTGNADFARFLGNGADTAASPSFTWSNDTNTGVFRGGADILGFSTAGTESMRILANGNVGIGTTSPTAKLMLSGSGANNDGILRIQSTSGGGDGALVKLGEFNYLNQDNSGAGYFSWGASFDGDTNQFVRQYTSNPAYLGFVKLGTTNGDVSIGSSTSNLQADTNPTMSTSLTVKGGTGYVGIGTASPSTALHVNGTATATLFSGSGASLTNLNGSNISTGTIANARLTGSGALTVTAGNGLTGGGSVALGSSTSLAIGAGSCITVGSTTVGVTDNCVNAATVGGVASGSLVQLQPTTPGTAQTGNINISGTAIAGSFSGNGASLTNLNASNLASGTVANARLTGSGALTVTAGSGLTGGGSVALGGSTTINVGADAITDTHLAFNTGQHLTVSSAPTFNGLNLNSNLTLDTSHIVIDINAGGGWARGLRYEMGGSVLTSFSAYGSSTSLNYAYIGEDHNNNAARFYPNGNTSLSGNVGIGKTSPTTALDVNGTATALLFSGSGASLTNLNGSNISTGTIANARLTGSGALTVTAGSGLTGGGSVALGGSTTINVGADAITDTHLAFNTGQHLTVTSTPTFSSLNLGSSGVLRFGGTAGYAYTSKPRYTVDNTTLLSDFDNYSRSLSFIENTASGHGYYGTYDTLKLYTNNAGIQYFYQYNGVTADTPIRYRTADYSGSGWNDWRSIASQEWANTNLVRIQGSTPGTAQSGHLNITGTAIAGSFSGNGSLLTNLNASNITSGTLAVARGGTGATTAAGARTNLGATTVGANFFTLTNPSAVTFARINADNTVSALSAADFRAAIGAGTGGGSVTSINVSGGTTGLTTSGGPITSSGTITLGGTLGVANGGTGASTAQAAINNISGLTTAGDLLYHNGSNSTRLARGTNGQCLTSNASTILWGSCGGGISGSGSNGQVSFWTGAGSQGGSSNFFWNNSTSSLGLGTASPSARLHVDGGSILATGTHGGGNGITVTGAGTRMFFDVNKSAFRAGYVDGNQWNNANVGNWSIALGYNTTASGGISTALGWDAIASGDTSIAIGAGAAASGDTSIAIGAGVTASSWASTALGQGTTASGSRSTAFGAQTTASGSDSTTFGTATTASGTSSTAFGFATTAQAYASTVLGRYNVIQGSTTSWVGTDQLFVVGNGSDASNRSNALTVLKNGNVGIGIASPSVALDVSGTVAATLFSGSGASLTNLNASSITSGTLAVARGGTGASTAQAAINNLSGLTASGDLLYYNGTNATRLARGTNGQCLTSNASTILWGACGGGGITTVGTFSTTNTHAGGATISGSQIIFQAASTTAPGMVSISNQSFVGDKTFTGSTTLGDASNDTLTINGTNVLIPNNLNIDSNTLFIDSTNNRIGIGTTSLAEGKLVVQSSSHGNESSSGIVSRINVTGEPSPSNAPSNYAGYFQATLSGHEIREGETVGVYGSVVADSPFSLWSGEMIGVKGFASLQNDTYYANLYGLQGGVSASSSSWAASAYGLHIKSAQVSSGGVIHDNYGIYIQNQTAGNNDYGLYIQGADTYALWVGSGASRLDGTLEVNGSSSGGSNAPLALDVQGGNATGSYSCTTPTFGLSGQCGYNGGGSSIIGGGGTSGLDGPNTSNAAAGGNGGEILIEGGAGGNVSGLYSISGSGGDIIIQGGAAGTGGTLSGSNGNVLLARDRGSVGIGTASPTELLHVAGNIRFTGRVQGDDGTVSLPAYTFQSDTNTGLYRPGSDILGVTTGGTEVARFTSGQLQMNNGTAAAPAFSFSSDADVGLYRAGTNIMGVTTAGTEVARFTSTQFAVVNGTAATPAITFTSDTNTGIFRSQADALAISSGGSVMFEVNTGGANVQGLFAVATLGGGQSTHVCWGGFGILSTCSSSARYKKDIATANWGLDQIRQLRPVTYNWKEDGRAGFGFIAEEVAQISPYFAFHHNGQIEGVNYSELTSVLAAGIQQLDVIVHNEKTRLDGVVSVNQMQQATLSNLMAGMNGLEMGISQVQDQLSAGAFSSLNITGPASIQNLQVVNNLTVGNNLTVSNRIITKHITISGHVRTAGDTPTFELGTTLDVLGAVIELSGLTVEVSGNDTSGTIRLITEDDPVGLEEGHLAQFNFANKFDTRPRVMLSSANAAATKAGLFVDNEQVTDKYFRLFGTDQLAPNSTYELNYWIVE